MSDSSVVFLILSAPFAAFSGYFFVKYNKNRKLHDEMVDAPNFTPSGILQEIKESESQIHRRLVSSETKPHLRRGLFFIDGLGQSPAPLKGKLDETMKLLLSIYFKTDIYSNEHLNENSENPTTSESRLPSGHTKRIVPVFEIKDYESNETVRVRLSDKHSFSFLDELVKKEEYFKLNFIEKILVFLAMIFKFFSKETIKGLRIGVREKEIGIKVDSLLSAYGTVLYDTQTNKISVEAADYIARDKATLVKLIGGEKNRNKWLFVFFSALTLGFLYLGANGLKGEDKKKKEKK